MFPLVIDLPVAASSYNNHQQEGYIALIEFFKKLQSLNYNALYIIVSKC